MSKPKPGTRFYSVFNFLSLKDLIGNTFLLNVYGIHNHEKFGIIQGQRLPNFLMSICAKLKATLISNSNCQVKEDYYEYVNILYSI